MENCGLGLGKKNPFNFLKPLLSNEKAQFKCVRKKVCLRKKKMNQQMVNPGADIVRIHTYIHTHTYIYIYKYEIYIYIYIYTNLPRNAIVTTTSSEQR